jgi:site-specific recombinase XerC
MVGEELTQTNDAGDVALPDDLVQSARNYARASHAKRTQEAYARAWKSFEAWCGERQLQELPAAPKTVAVWMAALADGTARRKPLARSSIDQALSAVIVRHRDAGFAFDRKHAAITRVWKGICNTKARKETVRKAKPILGDDLRALVESLNAERAIDARDAALLALRWAAALRRSELVGNDRRKLGAGSGFVCVDERGIVVTLMASKASQDQAETIVVPAEHMPRACQALERWAAVAELKAGEPVFRAVDQRQIISNERLTDRRVARIVKSRARLRPTSLSNSLAATACGLATRLLQQRATCPPIESRATPGTSRPRSSPAISARPTSGRNQVSMASAFEVCTGPFTLPAETDRPGHSSDDCNNAPAYNTVFAQLIDPSGDCMRRREFIGSLIGTAVAWPLGVKSQGAAKHPGLQWHEIKGNGRTAVRNLTATDALPAT